MRGGVVELTCHNKGCFCRYSLLFPNSFLIASLVFIVCLCFVQHSFDINVVMIFFFFIYIG